MEFPAPPPRQQALDVQRPCQTGSSQRAVHDVCVAAPGVDRRERMNQQRDLVTGYPRSRVAYAAQPNWATLPYEERAAVMRRAAKLTETHRDEIVEWVVRESGSTCAKAPY
jgi:chlorite dismutase